MASGRGQAKRKASDIELPVRGQDAGERKRVLNVLAQRRYRQRKREHVQRLEAQTQSEAQLQNTGNLSKKTTSQRASPEEQQHLVPGQLQSEQIHKSPSFTNGHPVPVSEGFANMPFDHMSFLSPTDLEAGQFNFSQNDPFAAYEANAVSFPMDGQCFWDTSVLLPSLPSTPLSSETDSSSNESATLSLTSLSSENDIANSSIVPKSASPRPSQGQLQFSFPDEANFEMLELTLLNVCMKMAERLNINQTMWSLTAVSPFLEPSTALGRYDHLPASLKPTMTQMTIPHHPIADLLPWPGVRDRLIMILSQPPEMRPSQAASPTALIDFVYDLEDSAEGIRISGNDPYSGNNWEVGEKLFKSWWWLFDRDVIRRSNELRESRGAPMLGTSPGSVLGEVV